MVQSAIEKPADIPENTLQSNSICVLAVALFATGFPAAEELLKTWGPISLITVRLVLSCGLLVLMWILFDGWRRVVQAPMMRGLSIGAFGFGTGAIMMLVAQDLTDPVTAVLAAATMPATAVALEVLFDGRRLTRNFVFGACLVLIGGYLATGIDMRQATYGLGIALGLLATALFAWGSRKTVKGLPEMSPLGQCTITLCGAMLFSMATLAAFQIFGWSGSHAAPLGLWGWSMLLIYALGAMALSQAFWILGVSRLGIGIASFHLNAAPFYVMLMLFALGDDWDWNRALGAAILGAGVILAQRQAAR